MYPTILTAQQLRNSSNFTFSSDPTATASEIITAAAKSFVAEFVLHFGNTQPVFILCGNGGNGANGLAVARLLSQAQFTVTAICVRAAAESSPLIATERSLLQEKTNATVISMALEEGFKLPEMPENAILIDAILGTGQNKALGKYLMELIFIVNKLDVTRVALDVCTGLPTEGMPAKSAFKAAFTFTVHAPKLAFFQSENEKYIGQVKVLDIGLTNIDPDSFKYYYLTKKCLQQLLIPRAKFSHKGSYGRSLLIGGSLGMMGAAILAGRAALRSGVGLLTFYAPQCGYEVLQATVPEAMVFNDPHKYYVSVLKNLKTSYYDGIGIGCGMGNNRTTQPFFDELMRSLTPDLKVVIDADALNALADKPELWAFVPKLAILTPHFKEFDRLFGRAPDSYTRLRKAQEAAAKFHVIIVIKGASSAVVFPDGKIYYNTTGNPGMAVGGTGDVLTGIITGLLAQGYSQKDAALLGVYWHGASGDCAAHELTERCMTAQSVVDNMHRALKQAR